jgi:hypothetical protein
MIMQCVRAWFRWRCRRGRHQWTLEQRLSKTLAFYTRVCIRCGRFEVQNAGPMGDGKWVTPDQYFTGPVGDWERDQFSSTNAPADRPAKAGERGGL